MRLVKRVEALEAQNGDAEYGRAFLWCHGQPLSEALEQAGLALADEPLLAIRLTAVARGEDGKPLDVPDRLYERDRHLVS